MHSQENTPLEMESSEPLSGLLGHSFTRFHCTANTQPATMGPWTLSEHDTALLEVLPIASYMIYVKQTYSTANRLVMTHILLCVYHYHNPDENYISLEPHLRPAKNLSQLQTSHIYIIYSSTLTWALLFDHSLFRTKHPRRFHSSLQSMPYHRVSCEEHADK